MTSDLQSSARHDAPARSATPSPIPLTCTNIATHELGSTRLTMIRVPPLGGENGIGTGDSILTLIHIKCHQILARGTTH